MEAVHPGFRRALPVLRRGISARRRETTRGVRANRVSQLCYYPRYRAAIAWGKAPGARLHRHPSRWASRWRVVSTAASRLFRNESSYIEGNIPPSRCENSPREGRFPPSRPETLPSRGKDLPSRGKTLPSRGKVLPSRGKNLPSRGRTLPSRGKNLPSRGKDLPSRGKTLPSRG
jgi:hypothetical protein